MGKTLLFLKDYELLDQLDALREVKIIEHIIHLQACLRMVRYATHFKLIRKAARMVQERMRARDTHRAYSDVKEAAAFLACFGRGYIVRQLMRRFNDPEDPLAQQPPARPIAPDGSKTLLGVQVQAQLNLMTGVGRHRASIISETPTMQLPASQSKRSFVMHSGWLSAVYTPTETPKARWAVLNRCTLSLHETKDGEPRWSYQLNACKIEQQNGALLLALPTNSFAPPGATEALPNMAGGSSGTSLTTPEDSAVSMTAVTGLMPACSEGGTEIGQDPRLESRGFWGKRRRSSTERRPSVEGAASAGDSAQAQPRRGGHQVAGGAKGQRRRSASAHQLQAQDEQVLAARDVQRERAFSMVQSQLEAPHMNAVRQLELRTDDETSLQTWAVKLREAIIEAKEIEEEPLLFVDGCRPRKVHAFLIWQDFLIWPP